MGKTQEPGSGSRADRPQNLEVTGNLPMSLTTFVGRESELDELRSLLRAGKRLVTLVLGERRGANQAAEAALALAEADRLVLPFAMTGARELLEALPAHETAHAGLLAGILDVLCGSPVASGEDCPQLAGELSAGELRVLRYLPTNLSRQEIADELSVSVNTVSTHLSSIYAKLGVNDRTEAVNRARKLRVLTGGSF